jgi:hypothetical protein
MRASATDITMSHKHGLSAQDNAQVNSIGLKNSNLVLRAGISSISSSSFVPKSSSSRRAIPFLVALEPSSSLNRGSEPGEERYRLRNLRFQLFGAFFDVFGCVEGDGVLNAASSRRTVALPAFERLLRLNTMNLTHAVG